MKIIKCRTCNREIVRDYVNTCPYCKTELIPYNPALSCYQRNVKHRWKKYIESNIEFLCKAKNISKASLFQDFDISNDIISRLSRMKENDPIIQKLADFFNMSENHILYDDLRLPEGCRYICQYNNQDAFVMRLLIELEKNGIEKWNRLSREDTYKDGVYRQIGFRYDGDEFELRLKGFSHYTNSDRKNLCKKLPEHAYHEEKIIVMSVDDYRWKNLYSDYNLYLFLLDNVLERFNIGYEDWDTYPEFSRGEYKPDRISLTIDVEKTFADTFGLFISEISKKLSTTLDTIENNTAVSEEDLAQTRDEIRQEFKNILEKQTRKQKLEQEKKKQEAKKLANELMSCLEKKKNAVNESFGYKCKLIKRDTDTNKEELLYKGPCYDCIEKAVNSIDALLETEQYVLVHFHKIYISELIFDPWEITYSLKTIDENSVICVKPEVIPFSEKILPKKYNKHFENSINKYNVSELWNDVQTIKQRYFSSAISADREYSKDYLSEASYEIARYIENVRWAGDEPKVPDEFRSVNNCLSYVDMDQEQFSYYLFWRTKILDGIVIPPHNLGFIGTLLSELIMHIGIKLDEEILRMMNTLELGYAAMSNGCRELIIEYKTLNGYIEKEPISKGVLYHSQYGPIEKNDYRGLAEQIIKKSPWKLKSSSFIKKVDCANQIREAIELMIPQFQILFSKNGLDFSEFIVGRFKPTLLKHQYYSNSLWTSYTLKRILDINEIEEEYYEPLFPPNRIIVTDMEGKFMQRRTMYHSYNDPMLCEYIVRNTEMMFRKIVGYKFISYPEKLDGAMKSKSAHGGIYYLSEDDDERKRELKYLSLYDDIFLIINTCFNSYVNNNAEVMAQIKDTL